MATKGSLRQELRTISEDKLIAFAEAALEATRTMWFSCQHCKKKTEVEVQDWSARTNAMKLVVEQGWGRAPAAEADSVDLGKDPARYSAAERAALIRSIENKLGIGDPAPVSGAASAPARD